MPTAINRSSPTQCQLKTEIALLGNLDLEALRNRWRTVFRRRAPPHLPRHLLFRMLAYQLQADLYGDLDRLVQRTLERLPSKIGKPVAKRAHITISLRAGTQLVREWKGKPYKVTVASDGFTWNGMTYPNLSKVAFAITGTRWNGPRFFGLRDRLQAQAGAKS